MSKVNIITALLAKAERTENPAEAEAYTAKAEALMIKHGIDAALLAASKPEQAGESIVLRKLKFTGAYAHAQTNGAYHVAHAMSAGAIKGFTNKRGNSEWTLNLVGFESEVDSAVMLINSLMVQSQMALTVWWATKPAWRQGIKSERHEMFMARRTFLQSFFSGASARLRERHSVEVSAAGTGTDLVLVDRKSKVEQHMAEEYGPMGKARGLSHGGVGAAAGYAAGRQAMTDKVTGGSRSLGRA